MQIDTFCQIQKEENIQTEEYYLEPLMFVRTTKHLLECEGCLFLTLFPHS